MHFRHVPHLPSEKLPDATPQTHSLFTVEACCCQPHAKCARRLPTSTNHTIRCSHYSASQATHSLASSSCFVPFDASQPSKMCFQIRHDTACATAGEKRPHLEFKQREFVRRTNAMVRFGARLCTPPVNACPSTLHVTPATPLSHVLVATANRIAGDDGDLTDDDDGRSLFPADCRFGPAIRRFRASAAPQRQAGTHCIFVGAGDGHDRFPTFLITILHFRWWLPEDRQT
jgi:hypothetical protein